MYKILHASSDYLLCSFEFEDLETGEHIFAHFFDDPYEELFQKFGLKQGQTLDGKVIAHIPHIFVYAQKNVQEKLAKNLLIAHGYSLGYVKNKKTRLI